ncbi:hypothetical protein [Micromonospora sp. NPDC005305]|uniref:hypothetical protein n=1 Tax=Micromonospora sp. NPDC005305 TaxID=3156875 RepID=UPI0033B7D5C0
MPASPADAAPTGRDPADRGDPPAGTSGRSTGSRRRGATPAGQSILDAPTLPGATAVPREPGRGHRRAGAATGRPASAAGRRPRADPAAAERPADPFEPTGVPELDGTGDPPDRPNRRRAALIALAAAATASAAALVAGLLSWSPEPAGPTGTARPLTAAEADRLAALRVTNQRDVRAGVRVIVGEGGGRTELVGWVDWARPLVYLDVSGPGAGAERGLVQATASTLLVRPDLTATPAPAPPPLVPPGDRWRLRELPAGRGLPAVRDLLLGLGAARVDAAEPEARWLRGETVHGVPVDVFQAPLTALRPAGGPSTPRDRQPRLWVDRDARLHRLAGRLPDGTAVTVELARTDRPTLRPVDALGGRPGLPRAVTDAEADRLARLPARLRAAGGADLTLSAPSADLRGTGWVSWAGSAAYLSVEGDDPGRRTLLRARPGDVARLVLPADGPAAPPLPAPAGLVRVAGRPPRDDVERLLDTALRGGGTAAAAVRIRDDRVADRTVDVIEVRDGLRWWLDRGGLPRRLELRTGQGVWIRLDLAPGRVPALPGAERTVSRPAKRP